MQNIFEGYNNFKNKLQEEKVESKDPHPWLKADDPRRKMTDGQILESTINLSLSCLSKKEQGEVYTLLVKDREAFSLGDEIGTCSYIEVDLQVTDKLPLFIRPFYVKGQDKPMVDKEI